MIRSFNSSNRTLIKLEFRKLIGMDIGNDGSSLGYKWRVLIGQIQWDQRGTDEFMVFHRLEVGGLDIQLDLMNEGDGLIQDDLKVSSLGY